MENIYMKDIWSEIFLKLDDLNLCRIAQLNKYMYNLVKTDNLLWKNKLLSLCDDENIKILVSSSLMEYYISLKKNTYVICRESSILLYTHDYISILHILDNNDIEAFKMIVDKNFGFRDNDLIAFLNVFKNYKIFINYIKELIGEKEYLKYIHFGTKRNLFYLYSQDYSD